MTDTHQRRAPDRDSDGHSVSRQPIAPYFRDDHMTLYHGKALDVARQLPSSSVDCIVTSPPYFQLRDYGADGQYGLEATPSEYVESLAALFGELRRVLTDDGTLWLNLGDTYSTRADASAGPTSGRGRPRVMPGRTNTTSILGRKQLLGIPWRVAFALQDQGWILFSGGSAPENPVVEQILAAHGLVVVNVPSATGVVQGGWRRGELESVALLALCVEPGHHFAVGGPRGAQFLGAVIDLKSKIHDLLFEFGDASLQLVDVVGRADAGFSPGFLAECGGEVFLELLNPGGQPGGSLLGVEQVGLQRCPGDRGVRWVKNGFGCSGMDLVEQIAVPVEEAAIDSRGFGDRADADFLVGGLGGGQCAEHTLATPQGVVASTGGHGSGAGTL